MCRKIRVCQNSTTTKPNPFRNKMTKDQLLKRMDSWNVQGGDEEIIHDELDKLLLGYIDDERVTAAFKAVPKWYS